MGYFLDGDLNRDFGFRDPAVGPDYLGDRAFRDYSGALRAPLQEAGVDRDRNLNRNSEPSVWAKILEFMEKHRVAAGVLGFVGDELDLGVSGVTNGVIVEHDTHGGTSTGVFVEGSVGDGFKLGGGEIIGIDSKGISGFFGFFGGKVSLGPLGSIEGGFIGNRSDSWGGLFFEGHVGTWARGGGFYVRDTQSQGN